MVVTTELSRRSTATPLILPVGLHLRRYAHLLSAMLLELFDLGSQSITVLCYLVEFKHLLLVHNSSKSRVFCYSAVDIEPPYFRDHIGDTLREVLT